MDREEVVCDEHCGRKCDVCHTRKGKDVQRQSQAEEQEKKYTVGPLGTHEYDSRRSNDNSSNGL